MKVGIKLHNHRSKGRIDTYHITKSPYTTDYRRGCLILQAIQRYQTQIGRACVAHLATFVTESWESHSNSAKISDIFQFMNHLMDTTGIQNKKLSLDETIQRVCLSDSPIPTVCPSITLLFAVRYIERLKQRYGDVQGTNGCARRLVLVAYIIAAKYIQSNLRVIIDMTDLPPLTKPISPTERRQSQDLTLPGLSTERRLSSAMLLSPPVSPKISQRTDPSQYHYFCGANVSNNLGISEHDRKTTMPSLSDICSDSNHPIWRMESEFLHFLNGDVKVPDCLRLMEWAHSSWL